MFCGLKSCLVIKADWKEISCQSRSIVQSAGFKWLNWPQHKCLEFPGTRFHNCCSLICAQSEIGRNKFCKLVLTKTFSQLWFVLVVLAQPEIRRHLNQGSVLFNQDVSNHPIGQLCLGREFPGKSLDNCVLFSDLSPDYQLHAHCTPNCYVMNSTAR